eukprot:TRINITY_DN13509_c0_g1_i1.p1 TRINITY_DN13509_c0_g1~~TRINITY_DN13509_c0_g1_i1.p1  ORF type:complete len:698 (+),score=220.47 TRINITY_DN13509_c0_g1_i1:462-2555(+)
MALGRKAYVALLAALVVVGVFAHAGRAEELGDLTDFDVLLSAHGIDDGAGPSGMVRETLPAAEAGVNEMDSIDNDPTGPSVKAYRSAHGKEDDPGGLLEDPEDHRRKLMEENGSVSNVVEVNNMMYGGHLNKKAKAELKQSNPDMLDKSEADAENVDDTNYLKTAATSTDSVPEAHQLNEPTSGFGTATIDNDEQGHMDAPPGTGTAALPVTEDDDNQGTADPVGTTMVHPSDSDTAPAGTDAGHPSSDDIDMLLQDIPQLIEELHGYGEDDDDADDDADLNDVDDVLAQLDAAVGSSSHDSDANVRVTRGTLSTPTADALTLTKKESSIANAAADEYGADGYRDTQKEVDDTLSGLFGLQGRIKNAIATSGGKSLSNETVMNFMNELVGVQSKLLGSYDKLQHINAKYGIYPDRLDLSQYVKKAKAKYGSAAAKTPDTMPPKKKIMLETMDVLLEDDSEDHDADHDDDDHDNDTEEETWDDDDDEDDADADADADSDADAQAPHREDYHYHDEELPADVLAQIDMVKETLANAAKPISEGQKLRQVYAGSPHAVRQPQGDQRTHVVYDLKDPHPEDRHPHPEVHPSADQADCHVCTKALTDILELLSTSRGDWSRLCSHLNGDREYQCNNTFKRLGVDPLITHLQHENHLEICHSLEVCDPNFENGDSRSYIDFQTNNILEHLVEGYAVYGSELAH